MRRRVVGVVVMAENPVHEHVVACCPKCDGALVHLAVAEDDIRHAVSADGYSAGVSGAWRALFVTPFRYAVRVETVQPFDMMGQTALNENAAMAGLLI